MLSAPNFPHLKHYNQILISNGFTSCITNPTRITKLSQTSIDHLITNVNGTIITPDVLQFSIFDHLPIFCTASSAKHKNPFKNSTHYYRNIKNLNGDVYRDDLYDTLTPIVQKFQTSSISASNFDLHFNNLVIGINKVIEKHASLQKVSRKLSRIRQKPWMTKGLLIFIKNKQKLYRNFFLKGTAFGKHFYEAYANKLTRVKNLSKKNVLYRVCFKK